jgi:2-dehydro-3-deoxygluconokinase
MTGPTIYGEAALHVLTSVRPAATVNLGMVEVAVGGPAAVVSLQLARLGHGSRFVGMLGDDWSGRFIEDTLESAGVDCTGAVRAGRTPRIVAAVAHGEVELAADVHGGVTALQVGDQLPLPAPGPAYITGFPNLVPVIRHLAERGHRLVIDVGFIPLLSHPDKLLAHVRSVAHAIDVAVISGAALEPRYREAIAKTCLAAGATAALTTLAGDGVVVTTVDGACQLPAYAVDPVDPLCAGDAFVAGFLAGRLEGLDVAAAAGFGQAVAAVKLTQFARLPTRSEVDEFLDGVGRPC